MCWSQPKALKLINSKRYKLKPINLKTLDLFQLKQPPPKSNTCIKQLQPLLACNGPQQILSQLCNIKNDKKHHPQGNHQCKECLQLNLSCIEYYLSEWHCTTACAPIFMWSCDQGNLATALLKAATSKNIITIDYGCMMQLRRNRSPTKLA